MRAGAIISGGLHGAIIVFAMFGGPLFDESDIDEIEITEVSLINSADFEAAQSVAPDATYDQAVAPTLQLFDDTPVPDQEMEEPPSESPLDATPEMAQLIFNETSTLDLGADLSTFEQTDVKTKTRVSQLAQPYAPTDTSDVLTDPDTEPEPEPEPKITPEPIPEKETVIEEQPKPEPEPKPDPEIAKAAPTESVSPRKRPKPEEPKPEQNAQPKPPEKKEVPEKKIDLAKSIESVLKKPAQTVQQSGPLSNGEKSAVLGHLQRKWNLGSLMGLPQAETLIVTMRVRLRQDGYIYQNKVEMIEPRTMYSTGIQIAARLAADALRAAQPFKLPPGKYESWRVMEVTFNPREMVFK